MKCSQTGDPNPHKVMRNCVEMFREIHNSSSYEKFFVFCPTTLSIPKQEVISRNPNLTTNIVTVL